jgi:clan AA aspartic protease (TIGR02281 family)
MKTILSLLITVFIAQTSSNAQTIQMTKKNGVYEVPCKVNGLNLKFILDTGASTVVLSITEALFMLKNGYLSETDIMDTERYSIANGQIAEGTKVVLRKIQIGTFELKNVQATIIHNSNAPLLLGISALQRLGNIELNYESNIIKITIPKPGENEPKDATGYYKRARARARLQDYSGAIEDYNKLIETDRDSPPTLAGYYEDRGLAKVEINDLYGAISDFSKALEINPENEWMLYCRGVAKAKLGISSGCEDIAKAKNISDKGNLVYDLEGRLIEAMEKFCK